MLQIYLMNGIHGFILQKIRLRKTMILKNMNGKNHINLIRLVLKMLIIQTEIMNRLKRNIQAGKTNFILILLFFFIISTPTSVISLENLSGKFIEIKILDKVSSKTNLLKLKIGEEKKFQNLLIKSLKCKNSEFDDNPEITAYIQVRDLVNEDNNEVFIFNGWTFSSSPAVNPFDHPVYDIWLTKCY